MRKIINLTPHKVVLITENRREEIPPSGTVARVATMSKRIGEINGFPLFETEFGEVEGLPQPSQDTIYIVSGLVLAAAKAAGRTDVVAPATASAIRDSE